MSRSRSWSTCRRRLRITVWRTSRWWIPTRRGKTRRLMTRWGWPWCSMKRKRRKRRRRGTRFERSRTTRRRRRGRATSQHLKHWRGTTSWSSVGHRQLNRGRHRSTRTSYRRIQSTVSGCSVKFQKCTPTRSPRPTRRPQYSLSSARSRASATARTSSWTSSSTSTSPSSASSSRTVTWLFGARS